MNAISQLSNLQAGSDRLVSAINAAADALDQVAVGPLDAAAARLRMSAARAKARIAGAAEILADVIGSVFADLDYVATKVEDALDVNAEVKSPQPDVVVIPLPFVAPAQPVTDAEGAGWSAGEVPTTDASSTTSTTTQGTQDLPPAKEAKPEFTGVKPHGDRGLFDDVSKSGPYGHDRNGHDPKPPKRRKART